MVRLYGPRHCGRPLLPVGFLSAAGHPVTQEPIWECRACRLRGPRLTFDAGAELLDRKLGIPFYDLAADAALFGHEQRARGRPRGVSPAPLMADGPVSRATPGSARARVGAPSAPTSPARSELATVPPGKLPNAHTAPTRQTPSWCRNWSRSCTA